MTLDHTARDGSRMLLPAADEESGVITARRDAQDTVPSISAETSTAMLRSCTALATRARVELLGQGRRSVEELHGLLGEMARWEDAVLVAPDPTMLVLAAAALQDLIERLDGSQCPELCARIGRVLERLHAEMDTGAGHGTAKEPSALGASA